MNPTFIPVDIEDAVRRPFLNSLSKNLQYSLHIFEKVLETGWKTPFEQVDVTILSLYRKLLTQFDGIFILLDHGSLNAAVITARSALETYASLMFIFEDGEDFVEKRATSYYTFYKLEELKHLNDPKVADRISASYSVVELQKMKDSIKNLIYKQSPYKEVSELRFELIKTLRNMNRKVSVHWYSLYQKNNEEIFSLSALIDYVDRFGNDLNKLYSLLSFETHSLNARSDLDFQNNQVTFDDLRVEENIENYDLFRQVRDFLGFPTFNIISRYLTKAEIVNFGKFYDEDRAI
ncbi:DUF5677 domain-containing protein [Cytobacillus gottheilii]|uniref:Uncharacterized protein n=1 Tax=Cytobacillus gottheilii TaxID=859144 RepID=A0ABX8FDX4_9BACI|nr:DUF5677 domain-containing protein [Cytobacillus gottheilii]QVY62081.1 hypothetical protein J1899_02915 [Cytobacillus gottheilii]